MAHIVVYQPRLEDKTLLSAQAKELTTGGEAWTSLQVSRGGDTISFYFDHDEENAEELHNLLMAVMDAFRQVDGAVQRQAEVAA